MPRKAAVQELPDTGALFPLPESAPLPKVAKLAAKTVKAAWVKYTGQERCDDCKQVTVDAYPAASPPWLKARWKRVANGEDRLLCHEHARHWRHLDKLDIPKAMREAG